jgi:serine O-acetyltransferase
MVVIRYAGKMDESLRLKTVDALLDSYAECGGINHIDGVNLPSKLAIAEITGDLLKLLFPGFFSVKPLERQALPKMTEELLRSIELRLTEELAKSLDYRPIPGKSAQDVMGRFLDALVGVRCLLQTDVEAAFQGDPAALATDEVIVSYPGVEAISVQRMAHVLFQEGVALIPRIMTEWAHSRTGIDIHPGAKIGSYFFIDHGTGVVIGETSEIGSHVKLYQGVSLIARSLSGGQTLRGQKRHPTVENDVTIYAGATIIGGDTVIGAGSTIGASVFLMHSVPARSLVFHEEKQLRILDKNKRGESGLADWQI